MFFLYAAIILILIIIIYIVWQKRELGKFETTLYRITSDSATEREDRTIKSDSATERKDRTIKSDSSTGKDGEKVKSGSFNTKVDKTINSAISKKNAGNDKGVWTKFVVIADLHNQQYGRNNEELIRKIDEISPDFIIVAGDTMIAKPGHELDVSLKFIEKISQKYKIYYGMGNHEYRLKIYPQQYPGMYEKFYEFINAHNVTLLENESDIITLKNRKLKITGLEIERNYYKRLVNVKMDKEYITHLVGEKSDEYTILIAHNPEYFKAYSDWGADLVLAGHIHGGMVRLPFLGGAVSPKIRLFPKYDAGLFERAGSKMIVSRGLGMHTLPIRINNRAQLVVVELLE